MQKRRSNALGVVTTGLLAGTMTIAAPRAAVAQANHIPEKNPWSTELCIVGICEDVPGTFTAPANRLVVVDGFSGECSIPNAGVFRGMRAVLNDKVLHLFIPERALVGLTHTIYDWNKQTRMVIPPNGTLKIDVFAVSGLPDITYCRFYLTGYTVKP